MARTDRDERRRDLWIEENIGDLVEDKQWHASDTLELVIEPAGPLSSTEAIDPLVGGPEPNPLRAPARLNTR